MSRRHDAQYSRGVIEVLYEILNDETAPVAGPLVDPFAGMGLKLPAAGRADIVGIELEPEWAAARDWVRQGDALDRSCYPERVGAIVTSPCLAVWEPILTADLRWVRAGEVAVGDRLLAFDEEPDGLTARGHRVRRRFQWAEVVRSSGEWAECARVTMADGSSVVVSVEHPWLATRYADRSRSWEWVATRDLMGLPAPHVARQFTVWNHRPRTWEEGWLAGMLDGEGSLSFGQHGSPKLVISQKTGETSDLVAKRFADLGFSTNVIERRPDRHQPANRWPVENTYVTGGFGEIARALGALRPGRLLAKFQSADVSSRRAQFEKVRVVSVEPVGWVRIQQIETSTGTYFGAGYAMHNCYGNRLADQYLGPICAACNGRGTGCPGCGGSGRNGRGRYSYAISLGRRVSTGSAAALQWGHEYRVFHERWLRVIAGLLEPGERRLILNMSDHYRARQRQYVCSWWLSAAHGAGFRLVDAWPADTDRIGHGRNAEKRAEREMVFVFDFLSRAWKEAEES